MYLPIAGLKFKSKHKIRCNYSDKCILKCAILVFNIVMVQIDDSWTVVVHKIGLVITERQIVFYICTFKKRIFFASALQLFYLRVNHIIYGSHYFCFQHTTEHALFSFKKLSVCTGMQHLSALPVYNCTHVQADILKSSHSAFLHSVQISRLVIHQDCLHTPLKGMLGWREQCLQKVA